MFKQIVLNGIQTRRAGQRLEIDPSINPNKKYYHIKAKKPSNQDIDPAGETIQKESSLNDYGFT
jgi:hypothetical protein